MSYPYDMNDKQYEIGTWADKTFPLSSPTSIIAHMRREMTELSEATTPAEHAAECADIAMLLFHLAHKEGWSLQDAIRDKFEINKGRQWGPIDAEGVVEHIRA